MAHRVSTKRNQRPRTTKARRRRMVGLSSSVGAFLAFGLGPLAAAPPAHADELGIDSIIDAVNLGIRR